MSDSEDNSVRAPVGDENQSRLPSSPNHDSAEKAVTPCNDNPDSHWPPHEGTSVGRSEVYNNESVPLWPPLRGTSAGRQTDVYGESQRLDAHSSRRRGASSQQHQVFGGQGTGMAQTMYPFPYQPMPYQYYGHPAMYGPQPMSGMAGVGYALMPQHSQPASFQQPSACAGPEPQASTSSAQCCA